MSDRPDPVIVRAGVLDVEVRRSGDPTGGRWCCCTASRTTRAASTGSPSSWPMPARTWSCRGCAATAAPGSWTPRRMRSGQQAALAHDLLELIDALGLETPGRGRLRLGRPRGLRGRRPVAGAGLGAGHRQRLPAAGHRGQPSSPSPPHLERQHWYQYYLHGERGRAGLRDHRAELARLLWQEWSPTWAFTEEDFEATRAGLRQPRLRRRRRPLLPPPVRPGRRRPGVRRHRAPDRRSCRRSPCRRSSWTVSTTP